MKSYKYILFDWDGNLAKTLHIWLDSTATVLKRNGYSKTDQEIIDVMSELANMEGLFGIKDIDRIISEIDAEVKHRLPSVELYPDALFVLEKLHKQGKHLALVTSAKRHLVANALAKYKLEKLFEVSVTRDDVANSKPHPEPMELALKLLGGNKKQAIMIGDTEKDLGGATNTGIDSILFFPPEHAKFYDLNKLKTYSPTYIVSDFKHILKIIA